MTSIETSVFAKTVHKAHDWLNDLRGALGAASDEEAYRALRATLHVLRDSLTVEEIGDLSAQLPLLVRGLFLEGWSPGARRSRRLRRQEDFLAAVQERYGTEPIDARQVVACVLGLLEERVSAGEIEDVKQVLPQALRGLWLQPSAEGGGARVGLEEGSVGQHMSQHVLTVSAASSLQDALQLMGEVEVRHLVVLAPEQAGRRPVHLRAVVGLLSNRDALATLRRHPSEDVRLEWLLVSDVMTRAPLQVIAPEETLSVAAARMHDEGISALVVVEAEELLGILTSGDLLYALGRVAQGASARS